MISTTNTQAELDNHFVKCYTDFSYYAKHNLKIRTKSAKLVPFELNEVQLVMEDILAHIESQGMLIRLYILKARQEGISTWSTGRNFWKASNNRNKSAVIVTHEPPATRNLFDMQKRYYKHLQPEFKPLSKYNNVKMLQFDNDDGTGLDSSIIVSTAGVKDFGSSQTINYLHISELSKWPRENEEDLLTSLFQCVPDESDTSIIIESTAKGASGEFYKGYNQCRYVYLLYLDNGKLTWKLNINEDADETNIYASVFIPWYVFKEYRKTPPDDFERTAEEQVLSETYGLDNSQLYWYRFILSNKCKGNKVIRDQEYPTTPESAFIGSGSPAFNLERVLDCISKCPVPKDRYEYNGTMNKLSLDPEGSIKIWEDPIVGVPYLISADVAEGLKHGDFDSAIVWNHQTRMQVAEYHGKMSPFKFAKLLYFLGFMYNTAWIVPERNNHGISVVEKLLELDYPNLYVEVIPEPPHRTRRRFGWITTDKSRVLILDHLIDEVADGIVGIRSADVYKEMLTMRAQADGKIEADSGMHDDRVMAAAIGKYTMKALNFSVSFRQNINSNNGYSGNISSARLATRPPVSAWN